MSEQPAESAAPPGEVTRRRRPATTQEIKALAHPLRIRILRLCLNWEMTNKELADRLHSDPGTVYYHVRQLVAAGLLVPGEVRTGESGALEKPYRTGTSTWWLDGPLNEEPADVRFMPIEAFQEELREAGPESVATSARFVLHLTQEEVEELDRKVLAILDEYIATDGERRGDPERPAHGGIFLLHRLAGEGAPHPAAG
jgi:DNA-binding transcriptional ArsR family regulator